MYVSDLCFAFIPLRHTDLVSLLLQLHDLVKVGHASLLFSLPVQLECSHFQLQLLALRLQLQNIHLSLKAEDSDTIVTARK